MKAIVTFVITAAVGVIFDIVTKGIVFSQISEFDKITLIPGLINILQGKNTGVVFGMFPGRTSLFIVFSMVAIAIIIFIFIKSDKAHFISNLALGLVLAGALGNLWDRIRYGYVRDFIDLHIGNKFHWPTFNIADSLICVGVALMVFCSFAASKTKTVL